MRPGALRAATAKAAAKLGKLRTRIPVAQPVVAPLISVLGTLALLLPTAVLRWPHRRQPYAWQPTDTIFWCLLGASLGWLIADGIIFLTTGREHHPSSRRSPPSAARSPSGWAYAACAGKHTRRLSRHQEATSELRR